MPKIVDHEQRRAAIADAAAQVIAEEGLEAATMKRIATRAGVTTGAVTHYFADKDDLVLAALLLVDAAMHRRLRAALDDGEAPIDALLAALPNDPRSQRDWRVWRVFSDHATRSELLRQQYRDSSRAWLQAALGTTDHASDDLGGPPPTGPAALDAELLVAVVDAIGDAASVDPESWPIDRQRRLLAHALERLQGPVRS